MLTLQKFEEAYEVVSKVVHQTNLVESDFFQATRQPSEEKKTSTSEGTAQP